MPGGGSLLGFGYFAGVKAAGYVGASALLKSDYQSKTNVLVAGIARTALGIAVGAVYGGLLAAAAHVAPQKVSQNLPFYVFFAGLIPVRVFEWYLFIWFFFDRAATHPKIWYWVVAGILWSFLIDAAAIFAAFASPGGMWIC